MPPLYMLLVVKRGRSEAVLEPGRENEALGLSCEHSSRLYGCRRLLLHPQSHAVIGKTHDFWKGLESGRCLECWWTRGRLESTN